MTNHLYARSPDAPHRASPFGRRHIAENELERAVEEKLDQALEDTFPASDPIAVSSLMDDAARP